MKFTFLLSTMHLMLCAMVLAAPKGTGRPWKLYLALDYLYTSSEADKISGAAYSKKFSNPVVPNFGVGTTFWERVYVGARYDYWYGGRKFALGGEEQSDDLNLQTVGLELGYYNSNPRVYMMALFSGHYPVQLAITSKGNTTQNFSAAKNPIVYALTIKLGVRFSSFYSLMLEGGYRYTLLGRLKSNNASFLPSGGNLDLSGMFLGLGLLFEF